MYNCLSYPWVLAHLHPYRQPVQRTSSGVLRQKVPDVVELPLSYLTSQITQLYGYSLVLLVHFAAACLVDPRPTCEAGAWGGQDCHQWSSVDEVGPHCVDLAWIHQVDPYDSIEIASDTNPVPTSNKHG